MTQQGLFDDISPQKIAQEAMPPLERFQGAMLYSAIGDALGWPTEFINPQKKKKLQFELPVRKFVSWKKNVGGRWWGFEEKVSLGEYSDDTQLTLALARCITISGEFVPEKFAYAELPLWLGYERGGGKAIKIAARNLVGKNANWLHNFYQAPDVQYRNAGANGAAMRNLPLALVYCGNEVAIIKKSFMNSIITHGHPRAIIGTIIFGLAINYILLTSDKVTFGNLFEYLHEATKNMGSIVKQDKHITQWLHSWDSGRSTEERFSIIFNNAYKETLKYLKEIPNFLNKTPEFYYELIGALNPTTKGSGVATVCAAIYLFLQYADQPEEGLITSANMLGSDTDTIGCILGALLGAKNGLMDISSNFADDLQDNKYILSTAYNLHKITSRNGFNAVVVNINQGNIQNSLKEWETEFDKMLVGTIDINGTIRHPTIGQGTLLERVEEPTLRQGYITKLFTVQFDCGQTCIFRTRVENK